MVKKNIAILMTYRIVVCIVGLDSSQNLEPLNFLIFFRGDEHVQIDADLTLHMVEDSKILSGGAIDCDSNSVTLLVRTQ